MLIKIKLFPMMRPAVAALVVVTAAGCSGQKDTGGDNVTVDLKVPPAVTKTVEQAGRAVKNAEPGISRSANEGIRAAAKSGRATFNIFKINTALSTDAGMKGSKIEVETLPNNRLVLRGQVRSAAQRTHAVRLARQKVFGYEVIDRLQISGAPTAPSGNKPGAKARG